MQPKSLLMIIAVIMNSSHKIKPGFFLIGYLMPSINSKCSDPEHSLKFNELFSRQRKSDAKNCKYIHIAQSILYISWYYWASIKVRAILKNEQFLAGLGGWIEKTAFFIHGLLGGF